MKSYSIVLALATVFIGCGQNAQEKTNAPIQPEKPTITLTDAQIKNAAVTIGKAVQREVSSLLRLNGKIDVPPQNMVSISVPLGGYLKSTRLLPGMHVSRGEVIAVMEDQQYVQLQQDYLTAKAKVGFLEKEFERQKELNQSKASSDKVFQQAELEFKSHRILMASLAEKLKLVGIHPQNIQESNISRSVNVYSPINGFVSKVNVNIGKYVSPTEVLFELVNPADIHLALKVFEKDLDKLFIGQKLVAFTNNQPGKKHKAEVLLISKDLSADRNADVHCHFDVYDKVLVPGTYMNAEIEVNNKKALTLPVDAIVRFEGKNYVFLAKGGNLFEMKEINMGETDKGFTEINIADDPQVAGEEFVTGGAYSILMLMKNKAD